MLDEVFGFFFSLFKGTIRLVWEFIGEIIFELLIKGPGYFLVKRISSSEPNPDGFAVLITGILFWALVGFLVYAGFS